jgi:hypothetical protein
MEAGHESSPRSEGTNDPGCVAYVGDPTAQLAGVARMIERRETLEVNLGIGLGSKDAGLQMGDPRSQAGRIPFADLYRRSPS